MAHVRRSLGRMRAFDGVAAVEFALASLLLMTMFMGTLDLGRAVFQRQELANAVREGARFAMVNASARESGSLDTQVASAASQRSPSLGLQAINFQTAGGGKVTCEKWGTTNWQTVPCKDAEPRNRLTICARYTFQPVATRLLRLGPLAMNDCSRVMIQ